MNDKPTLARRHIATTVLAGVLAALITISLLTAVTGLFQRDGAPFEQVVIAEHACGDYVFVSEREVCVLAYLAAPHLQKVATTYLAASRIQNVAKR